MGRKGITLFSWVIPKSIRKRKKASNAKDIILKYYAGLPKSSLNEEQIEALNYLKNNNLCTFPYSFQTNYSPDTIAVFQDKSNGLKYVICDGKRLYFEKKSSTRGIKRYFNGLAIEQDIMSPHRYLTNNFDLKNEDILVDVGAAEGILALSVIEKVKKVYLFETDENWIEALKATFSPWKDKVVIINKFVSDRNDADNISLDNFFQDKEIFNFLKIDAEGSEDKILHGCEKLLSVKHPLKIALCCYHRPVDDKIFSELLESKGFSISFSKGYMIYNDPVYFSPPYLRRGILRATSPAIS